MSIPITVFRLPIQRTAQIRGWGRFVWYAILVTLAVTLLVTTGTSAWADLETAREAARHGDHATAFRELLPLADAGDVDAQYYLGGLYYKGEGVEQDYAKAVKWFGESADQGNAKAQTDLAQCYLFGYGVERDSEVAVNWYRRAAVQGYAPATLNLAMLMFRGTGAEQDLVQAHKWATIAMSKFGGDDYESAVRIRSSVAHLLSPDLLNQTHRLAREWHSVEE